MRGAPETVTHCDCGHDAVADGCTTGYGRDKDGRTACFACCALRDRADMIATGRATLYLTARPAEDGKDWGRTKYDVKGNRTVAGPGKVYDVSNWPGTLRIPVLLVRFGRHNIARTRTDAWFRFEGASWHGVSYGENTQLIHCKRMR